MQALADNPAFWVLLVVVLVVVYLLPTIIAVIRGTDRLALVFLVNLIGAPSGVGWFAADHPGVRAAAAAARTAASWPVRPEPMQWPAGNLGRLPCGRRDQGHGRDGYSRLYERAAGQPGRSRRLHRCGLPQHRGPRHPGDGHPGHCLRGWPPRGGTGAAPR